MAGQGGIYRPSNITNVIMPLHSVFIRRPREYRARNPTLQ